MGWPARPWAPVSSYPWADSLAGKSVKKPPFVVDNAVHNQGAVVLDPRIYHDFVAVRK